MTKLNVTVSYDVEVTLDETKFTPEWMAKFSEDFYIIEDLDGHAQILAQLAVEGKLGSFVEGYGPAKGHGHSGQSVELRN